VVDSGFTLPWTPLFGEGVAEAGWAFLPFPVLLGFTDQTLTALPVQKAKRSANWLFLYALVIMAAGIAAHYWEPLLILAALVAAGWHEGLIWRGRREEEARSPLYVHDDRGLKVLAVLPSSPAQNMNVQPGEIIRKVNGRLVRTKEELHQALQINPAFCKLEIINLDGEPRFANHPIYAGDHHQLGIILCPDDDVLYYMAEKRQTGLIASIRRTLDGVVSNKQQQTM
jgi:membrane-associated protease RseP (regulator of RpoE activity)